MIPTYSLFTGNSDWNHEDRWSHLPAYRHRNALINGNISINTNISCKDIFIGNGNIHILPTGNLSVTQLEIRVYAGSEYIEGEGDKIPFAFLSEGLLDCYFAGDVNSISP